MARSPRPRSYSPDRRPPKPRLDQHTRLALQHWDVARNTLLGLIDPKTRRTYGSGEFRSAFRRLGQVGTLSLSPDWEHLATRARAVIVGRELYAVLTEDREPDDRLPTPEVLHRAHLGYVGLLDELSRDRTQFFARRGEASNQVTANFAIALSLRDENPNCFALPALGACDSDVVMPNLLVVSGGDVFPTRINTQIRGGRSSIGMILSGGARVGNSSENAAVRYDIARMVAGEAREGTPPGEVYALNRYTDRMQAHLAAVVDQARAATG